MVIDSGYIYICFLAWQIPFKLLYNWWLSFSIAAVVKGKLFYEKESISSCFFFWLIHLTTKRLPQKLENRLLVPVVLFSLHFRNKVHKKHANASHSFPRPQSSYWPRLLTFSSKLTQRLFVPNNNYVANVSLSFTRMSFSLCGTNISYSVFRFYISRVITVHLLW